MVFHALWWEGFGYIPDFHDELVRSVGNTVTVTRMGVPVWSKAVLKFSNTLTRPS